MVQGVVPKMVARKSGRESLAFVNGRHYGASLHWDLCATKHAIDASAGAMKTELKPYGVKLAAVNPGMYSTRFNDTGAESHVQSYDEKTAVVSMPVFGSALANQSDPKEMIDAMVEIITAEDHLHRTMRPPETIDAARKWQETEWTQNA